MYLICIKNFKDTQKRGLYGDVINEIDNSVGQILNTLKDEGLEEKTIIIYTSDNGPWLSTVVTQGHLEFLERVKEQIGREDIVYLGLFITLEKLNQIHALMHQQWG